MINNFTYNSKDDFYWRLKHLWLRATRNPADETVLTAKYKRISPIPQSCGREHEHENLTFLAVIFLTMASPLSVWVREFLCYFKHVKIFIPSKPGSYGNLPLQILIT
jgi:hypothetical protein